jgi:tetratricopeptide (TPR) repeat protein
LVPAADAVYRLCPELRGGRGRAASAHASAGDASEHDGASDRADRGGGGSFDEAESSRFFDTRFTDVVAADEPPASPLARPEFSGLDDSFAADARSPGSDVHARANETALSDVAIGNAHVPPSVEEERLRVENSLALALAKINRGGAQPLARAAFLLRDAVAGARRLGNGMLLGRALGNLGNALEQMHRSEEAVDCHLECMEVMRALGEERTRDKRAHILANLSVSYESLRRWDEALDCLRQQMALTSDEAALDGIAEAIEDVRVQKAHWEASGRGARADDADATAFTGTEAEDVDAVTELDETREEATHGPAALGRRRRRRKKKKKRGVLTGSDGPAGEGDADGDVDTTFDGPGAPALDAPALDASATSTASLTVVEESSARSSRSGDRSAGRSAGSKEDDAGRTDKT